MAYEYLNHHDLLADDSRYSDAWRQVLWRLGDHVTSIVRALNMRPREVNLIGETRDYVAVRISTPGEHLVLKLAPESDLSGEIFFYRTANAQQLPTPRVIHADVTRSLVPCMYALESYLGGMSAARIADAYMLRAAARQLGRTLRRMHRIGVPGFGRPSAGRWPTQSWRATLTTMHAASGAAVYGSIVFNAEQWAAVRAATLDSPLLDVEEARLIHGDLRPERVVCTVGEHVQLEGLVDPGPLVGGDGMYDLACGLAGAHADSFGVGLLEGYTALGPLSASEGERLLRLRLLTHFWETCRRYALGEDHTSQRTATLELLKGF